MGQCRDTAHSSRGPAEGLDVGLLEAEVGLGRDEQGGLGRASAHAKQLALKLSSIQASGRPGYSSAVPASSGAPGRAALSKLT